MERGADMAGRRSAGKLMATAAALTLPLWLGCCAPTSNPSAGSTVAPGATTIEHSDRVQPPLVPIPQPQAPPPVTAVPAETTGSSAASPSEPSGHASGGAPRTLEQGPGSAPASGTAAPGAAAAPGTTTALGASPSPAPESSAPPPAQPAPGQSGGSQTVTAYYVLLDDGGAGGVRFGCNDSLAGVRRTVAGSTEPLANAMRALLDNTAEPAPGLYNSLSGSTLTFLSGTFDGTAVTVYLSGSISPAGVCDIPRIEAQLTQTAVASVGAIRAEVYVNGVRLAEALRLQ
ncbi:GerMN domain-containing protein [Pseudarthrobacter sp. MDT1-22]